MINRERLAKLRKDPMKIWEMEDELLDTISALLTVKEAAEEFTGDLNSDAKCIALHKALAAVKEDA